jgi:hypothetical protein
VSRISTVTVRLTPAVAADVRRAGGIVEAAADAVAVPEAAVVGVVADAVVAAVVAMDAAEATAVVAAEDTNTSTT